LELPKRGNVKWDDGTVKLLLSFLREHFFRKNYPKRFSFKNRCFLQYKEPAKLVLIPFVTTENMKRFNSYLMRESLNIPGMGFFSKGSFKLHEYCFDPVIKFATVKKIDLAGWLSVKLVPTKKKFSSCDLEGIVKWRDVEPLPMKEIRITPKYCSFDIECYSKNHNSKIPDPSMGENVVFQISMIFGKLHEPDMKKYLLSLGSPLDINETTLIKCKSEKDLLRKFSCKIKEEDPDIFIGYNIMKFDWTYLMTRAELLGCMDEFLDISRLMEPATIVKESWESSAYGEQKLYYPNCVGRINVDVLIEIDRNHKVGSNRLDFVAEHFLGDRKKDISPRQLFMLFDITKTILPLVDGRKLNDGDVTRIREKTLNLLNEGRCTGEVLEYREQIKTSTRETLPLLVKKAMTMTGVYCVHDSVLPIRLVEKLNIWASMEALANVTKVPLSFLHTRGQGIKVIAQLLRETHSLDIVIPSGRKNAGDYQGAKVLRAVAGCYFNAFSLDFQSLYPSIIILFNICYTTCIIDESFPDEKCFILSWSQHIGCEHDPFKRKVKAKSVFCAEKRFRFLKPTVEFKDGIPHLKGEGIMPRLERNLLKNRKEVKWEMEKQKAKLRLHKGEATKQEIEVYKNQGIEIIEKGSLTEQQQSLASFLVVCHDSTQLALKISANSMYGGYSAKKGGYAVQTECAESVTAMGREMITETIGYVKREWPDSDVFYGDTDSCMVVEKNTKGTDCFALGKDISKKATHYLKCKFLGFPNDNKSVTTSTNVTYPIRDITHKHKDYKLLSLQDQIDVFLYEMCPIYLAFESVYEQMLMLTKKKYVCVPIDEKGKTKQWTSKGNMLVVRKNSAFCKKVYANVLKEILCNSSEGKILEKLNEGVDGLFTMSLDYYSEKNCVIIGSIKNVISYAKKQKDSNKKVIIPHVYVNKEGRPLKPQPTDPLDPRLIYNNVPHVQLALKLLRRGDSVPPNTKLEFVYVKNLDTIHKSDKMEENQYYLDHKNDPDGNRIDLIEYISQLSNSISQLVEVKFPPKNVAYEKLEDIFEGMVSKIKFSSGFEKRGCKTFETATDIVVGWQCLDIKKNKAQLERRFLVSVDVSKVLEILSGKVPEQELSCLAISPKTKIYRCTGVKSKIERVLASKDLKLKNNSELIKVAKQLRAKIIVGIVKKQKPISADVLGRVSSQYGVSLRNTSAHPSRTLKSIKPGGYVMIVSGENKGKVAQITKIDGDKSRTFDLRIGKELEGEDDRLEIKNVKEDDIRTFICQNKLLSNIVKARACYEEVCLELKHTFEIAKNS